MGYSRNRQDYYNNIYKTSWRRRLQLMLGRAQTAVKKGGMGRLTITVEDLEQTLQEQNGKDYFTGWELDLESVGVPLESPSLCKLDPEKGFSKENTVITSHAVSRAKADLSLEEFKALCRAVVGEEAIQPEAERIQDVLTPEGKIDVYATPNGMSNLMQRQLEEMNIKPLTGLRDLSWQEEANKER